MLVNSITRRIPALLGSPSRLCSRGISKAAGADKTGAAKTGAAKTGADKTRTCSIIPVPISMGQPLVGVEKTPDLLSKHGLNEVLKDCGWTYKQCEDVTTPMSLSDVGTSGSQSRAKHVGEIGANCKRVMDQVQAEATDKNNFLLILGGDHCIPIGTISGILSKRPNTGVVWVDAHADINTPESSLSGNMHGMPVSFLLGLVKGANKLPSMEWFKPCLSPKDIVYIGLRDLDKAEKVMIKELGIKAFTMYDIDKYGIGKVMEETLYYLSNKTSIHLSYDIDALDPVYAPSTGTSVRGGLTFREGNFICEALYESGKMTSMELVEVNPLIKSELDSKSTLDMSISLISSAMGSRIL